MGSTCQNCCSCEKVSAALQISASSELSVDISIASSLVSIPQKCIWIKARQLLHTDGAIVVAPRQLPEARMVLSYSGKPPHMVTPPQNVDFSCDASCPNWKPLGICSHSVAVAEMNGKLQKFLSAKKKKVPSVTNLLTTSMPKGRGRKGEVPPWVWKQKQAVTTRIEMQILFLQHLLRYCRPLLTFNFLQQQ